MDKEKQERYAEKNVDMFSKFLWIDYTLDDADKRYLKDLFMQCFEMGYEQGVIDSYKLKK